METREEDWPRASLHDVQPDLNLLLLPVRPHLEPTRLMFAWPMVENLISSSNKVDGSVPPLPYPHITSTMEIVSVGSRWPKHVKSPVHNPLSKPHIKAKVLLTNLNLGKLIPQ
jgi:hypothetical protein